METSISIKQFIRAIRKLPSDEPVENPRVWYKTQKEHWLGWLSAYHGPGAYGRRTGKKRDAKFAYNHVVNADMLLWLIEAAGVNPELVAAARREADSVQLLQQKSAAVRRHVPWEEVAKVLWPEQSRTPSPWKKLANAMWGRHGRAK